MDFTDFSLSVKCSSHTLKELPVCFVKISVFKIFHCFPPIHTVWFAIAPSSFFGETVGVTVGVVFTVFPKCSSHKFK